MTMLAHSAEGTIKLGALGFAGAAATRMTVLYTLAWTALAGGLVLFDRATWRVRPVSVARLVDPAVPAGAPA
jgi:hypothetical protein